MSGQTPRRGLCALAAAIVLAGCAAGPGPTPTGATPTPVATPSTVTRIRPDGSVTLLAGRWNPEADEYLPGPGDVARLRSPIGIVGDGEGLFYIVGDSAVFTMRCAL